MRLEDWRQQQGLTIRQLARRLGTAAETVRCACLPPSHRDQRIPRAGLMETIHVVTGGAVTPNDFYDLPPPQPEAAE